MTKRTSVGTLNFSSYPVVDSHCHPFSPEKETEPFERYLKLSDLAIPRDDIVNTLLYRQMMVDLSRVMGFRGTDEEIVTERSRRYRKDPKGYIDSLFLDAGIKTLLVDTGFPTIENVGYSIDLKEFSNLMPSSVKEIVRIEIILYSLIRNNVPFEQAEEEFHDLIRKKVKDGAIALKSIVAYRTGLGVRNVDEGLARKAYGEAVAEVEKGKRLRDVLSAKSAGVKAVFDRFVILGIMESSSLGIPFQMHTGLGDAPMDLMISNPLLLNDLINDPISKDAKIVLVHGGYPFIEEAGFLVGSYPNVFIDLSGTIPFIGVGAKEKLLNLLEMAPTNKIMHGSDGFNIPELYWLAAVQAKRSLTSALNEMIDSKLLDDKGAEEIARQFLSKNARRVYKL